MCYLNAPIYTGGGVGEGGKGPSYMLCPPSSQFLATPLAVRVRTFRHMEFVNSARLDTGPVERPSIYFIYLFIDETTTCHKESNSWTRRLMFRRYGAGQ
jgi:hypothetical protein